MLDAAIIAARFFQFASAAILFGSSSFLLYLQPLFGARMWPLRLLFAAASVVLSSGIAWLCLEAIALSGDAQSAADAAFLWSVLSETQFGRIFLLRMAVGFISIVAFALFPASRPNALWRVQAILGAVIVASFAWTGHGASDEGAAGMLHAGADVVHLLAAGIWIGALAPLSILLTRPEGGESEVRIVDYALMRFSGIGATVVAALVLSGLVNSWFLIGPSHIAGLLDNPYGVVLVAKLCLFAGMLGLAAANRYRLAPRLKLALESRGDTTRAVRALKNSVSLETGLGFLVLLAVGALGTLPPPISGG